MKQFVIAFSLLSLLNVNAFAQSYQNPFEEPPIIEVLQNLTNAINHVDQTFQNFEKGHGVMKLYGGLFAAMVTSALVGAVTTGTIITCYMRKLVRSDSFRYTFLGDPSLH